MKALKQLIKTPAGKELLEYLKGKCDELADVRFLPQGLSTEELGLHARASGLAREKFEAIIQDLEADEPKADSPPEYAVH